MTRYVLSAAICLLADIFVILTCWFWAGIAAVFNLDRLPGPLALLHTHDDTIYGVATSGEPRPHTITKRWTTAMWWLCRNPAYGVQAKFGVKASDVLQVVSSPHPRTEGIHDTLFLIDGSTRFGYRRDLMLGKSRYIKMWFGWHWRNQAGYHILKFDFNPFKRKD